MYWKLLKFNVDFYYILRRLYGYEIKFIHNYESLHNLLAPKVQRRRSNVNSVYFYLCVNSARYFNIIIIFWRNGRKRTNR